MVDIWRLKSSFQSHRAPGLVDCSDLALWSIRNVTLVENPACGRPATRVMKGPPVAIDGPPENSKPKSRALLDILRIRAAPDSCDGNADDHRPLSLNLVVVFGAGAVRRAVRASVGHETKRTRRPSAKVGKRQRWSPIQFVDVPRRGGLSAIQSVPSFARSGRGEAANGTAISRSEEREQDRLRPAHRQSFSNRRRGGRQLGMHRRTSGAVTLSATILAHSPSK